MKTANRHKLTAVNTARNTKIAKPKLSEILCAPLWCNTQTAPNRFQLVLRGSGKSPLGLGNRRLPFVPSEAGVTAVVIQQNRQHALLLVPRQCRKGVMSLQVAATGLLTTSVDLVTIF